MLFVYNKFKLKNWKKFNPPQRLKVLQAVENKLAKANNREPLEVKVHPDEKWDSYGMFVTNSSEKFIYVHKKLLNDAKLRFHALETIIHEGRHATQYDAITKKNIHWWNFKVKKWKKNFLHYINPNDDKIMYNTQAVENDAQKYALKILKKLDYKYINDDDYDTTIFINQYRIDKANTDAKEKYGVFYKQKINK